MSKNNQEVCWNLMLEGCTNKTGKTLSGFIAFTKYSMSQAG